MPRPATWAHGRSPRDRPAAGAPVGSGRAARAGHRAGRRRHEHAARAALHVARDARLRLGPPRRGGGARPHQQVEPGRRPRRPVGHPAGLRLLHDARPGDGGRRNGRDQLDDEHEPPGRAARAAAPRRHGDDPPCIRARPGPEPRGVPRPAERRERRPELRPVVPDPVA